MLGVARPSVVAAVKSRLSCRCLCSTGRSGMDHIYDHIKISGPITVADYMKHSLLHPVFGYYMQCDVFGRRGDFITSPEISQVFGELLAVWVLADWRYHGDIKPIQLVELGPGRGTLMKDMLRVRIHGCGQNFLYLCSFNGTQHKELCSVLVGIPVSIMGSGIPVSIMGSGIPVSIISGNIVYWYQVFQHKELCSVLDGLSLHLVEASPVLSNLQEQTLLKTHSNHSSFSLSAESGAHSSPDDISPYKTTSVDGVKVSWYKHLQDVPHGHSYFIAHEFFDALPVHQFQRTSSGWREVLVDINHICTTHKALRFVLAPSPTPASVAFTSDDREGEWLEVCPQGLVYVEELAERVVKDGGVALIADYGDDKLEKNTLRAFKNHQLQDVLSGPGTADMTADVHFKMLAQIASAKGAGVHGPISQNEFLHRLGIRQRIEALMKGATPSQAKDLVSSYEMLTSPEKMGERFKFFTITSSSTHVPLPFSGDINCHEL